jgi:lipopolysaccharide/colanic/teichoic acid biosynthesis glycosyltransferase
MPVLRGVLRRALFKQARIGKDGKTITIYKFRTMVLGAEQKFEQLYLTGPRYKGKIAEDPRVHSVGKGLRRFWIDELPQVLNILKREMNLVGYRPASQQFYKMIPHDLKEERKKYLPGLFSVAYAERDIHTLDDIFNAERRYFEAKRRQPFMTDVRYMLRFVYNFLFHGVRGV